MARIRPLRSFSTHDGRIRCVASTAHPPRNRRAHPATPLLLHPRRSNPLRGLDRPPAAQPPRASGHSAPSRRVALVPELRHDPVSGRLVVLAPERSARPHSSRPLGDATDAPADCPFCHGNEAKTPPEVCRTGPGGPDTAGWNGSRRAQPLPDRRRRARGDGRDRRPRSGGAVPRPQPIVRDARRRPGHRARHRSARAHARTSRGRAPLRRGLRQPRQGSRCVPPPPARTGRRARLRSAGDRVVDRPLRRRRDRPRRPPDQGGRRWPALDLGWRRTDVVSERLGLAVRDAHRAPNPARRVRARDR